jgi:hypothetical protein
MNLFDLKWRVMSDAVVDGRKRERMTFLFRSQRVRSAIFIVVAGLLRLRRCKTKESERETKEETTLFVGIAVERKSGRERKAEDDEWNVMRLVGENSQKNSGRLTVEK